MTIALYILAILMWFGGGLAIFLVDAQYPIPIAVAGFSLLAVLIAR